MRNKRTEKFKKQRHKKIRNIVMLTFVLPFSLITAGYLVASLFILPSINK